MATDPMNLVEAIGVVAPRYARTRSAVVRVGTVIDVPANPTTGVLLGTASVDIAGATVEAAYHMGRPPFVSEIVSVLCDRDAWLIVGSMSSAVNSVLPYTMSTGSSTLPINGKTSATVVVSFPANRFNWRPVVAACLYTGSGTAGTAYVLRSMTGSRTAITFGLNTQVAANADFTIDWVAVQMSTSSSVGLRVEPATEPDTITVTATCTTPDCGNYDIPIEIEAPVFADEIRCGVCNVPLWSKGA